MSQKKLIILTVSFISLITFLFVLAQEEPIKCCKIKRTFTLQSSTFKEGQCAAETEEDGSDCGCSGIDPNDPTSVRCTNQGGLWTIVCTLSTIYYVTDWIFYISLLISGVMVLAGSFMIATSAGNTQQWQKGKDIILYAMIGLAVALFSKIFPGIVKFFLGVF